MKEIGNVVPFIHLEPLWQFHNVRVIYCFHISVRGGEVSYINRLLQRLYDDWEADDSPGKVNFTKWLKSHSARPGGATDANSHPDVFESSLVFRGGWDMSALQNLFTYISATRRLQQ